HAFHWLEDVTDTRAADAERKRLALVTSKTNQAVIMSNLRGEVEWVNDGFTALTGYRFEEMRGQDATRLLRGPGTDPAACQRIDDGLRAGRIVEEEVLNYHRDGSAYWVRLRIDPIHDEHGRLTGHITMAQDVTERRHVDAARTEASQRL